MCEIEFGFKKNEIQHIVITIPKVLTANKRKLTQIFDYLHNTMKVPHYLITKFPQVDCIFFPLWSVWNVHCVLSMFITLTQVFYMSFYRSSIPSTCVSESATCFLTTLEKLSMTRPCPTTSPWTAWCFCQMRLFALSWLRPHWKIFICSKRHFDSSSEVIKRDLWKQSVRCQSHVYMKIQTDIIRKMFYEHDV